MAYHHLSYIELSDFTMTFDSVAVSRGRRAKASQKWPDFFVIYGEWTDCGSNQSHARNIFAVFFPVHKQDFSMWDFILTMSVGSWVD